jgi:HEAT repeat protein
LLFSEGTEKRLAAVEVLSKVDVEWPVAWLALLLADPDFTVANAAYQAIRIRGKPVLPLLSVQRLSPQPKVRQAVIRLLGEFGDLADLQEVVSSLFDPVVDIREEGKKSVEAILARALHGAGEGIGNQESIDDSMRFFASLTSVPQINVRAVMVACFLSLSEKNPAMFWELFPAMEIRAKNAIEHEILTHPNPHRIGLLYYGLVTHDPNVPVRAIRIVERLLSKDTISHHVESLTGLSIKDVKKALDLLAQAGMIGTFFEYFSWVRRDLRLPLLRLFHDEVGERYSTYLQGILKDANPHLVPTLIDDFLTFREDLPLSILRGLLENSSPVVQRSAIRYLHFRGDQHAVRYLIPLAGAEDPHTARPAVKAIGRISRDYLVDHFSELSDRQRLEMARMLQRVDEDFIESLVEILGGLDEEDRIHLTRILSQVSDNPDAERVLKTLMEDPSERIRATAVRGLETMDPAKSDPEQIDRLLSDPDPRVRANTIEFLPIEEKKKRIDRIEVAAGSESPRERANAILALYELGQGDYEIRLMQMLRHPDSWVRASGLWALSQIDCPHIMYKALELCSDSAVHVRVHALRAIGQKGDKELARQLTPWLSDPASDVREAAHKTIEKQLGFNYRV